MADVTVINTLSIKNAANAPIARANAIAKGFAVVADSTERDAILTTVKLGGFVVFREDTGQLERWNGSSWVSLGAGGGAGGMGFRFTYSTTTADADPGAGTFRGNSATLSSVTQLFVDVAEYGGTDITAWLDSLDDTNGGTKGIIRLQSLSDSTKWIEYLLTTWTTATGYRKLTVAYLAGPGGLLTTAGDTFFSFDAIGYTGTVPVASGGTGLTSISAANRVLASTDGTTFTTTQIVNAMVAAGAAIDGSKVSPAFVAQAISTTGTLASGAATITQAVSTSGSPRALSVTGGAHTTLALSTEAPDVEFALARAVQFATGALTTQRAVKITAPTYGFVGASTISDAATLAISGPPVAGTNATITRSMALWIESGRARFDGGMSFGSSVATQGDVRFGGTFSMYGTAAGPIDVRFMDWDGTRFALGSGAGSNGHIHLNASSAQVRVGSNFIIQCTSTIFTVNVVNMQFEAGSSIISCTTSGAAGPGNDLTTRGQNMTAVNAVAGKRIDHGGDNTNAGGGVGGANDRRGGDATGSSGTRVGGDIYDRPGTGVTTTGNWGWGVLSTDAVNFQSMQGGVYYKNAIAVPSGNPSGGGFLYSEAGALKWRGSGGTVTTMGPA